MTAPNAAAETSTNGTKPSLHGPLLAAVRETLPGLRRIALPPRNAPPDHCAGPSAGLLRDRLLTREPTGSAELPHARGSPRKPPPLRFPRIHAATYRRAGGTAQHRANKC